MFEVIAGLVGFGVLLTVLGMVLGWLSDRSECRRPPMRQHYHPPVHLQSSARQPYKPNSQSPPTPPVREGYGPGWKVLSRAVRERDNWICYVCGWQAVGRGRYFIHAHHLVARGRGGLDTPENLISLCLECHADQPGHQRMRYSPDYQRFMDRRYG